MLLPNADKSVVDAAKVIDYLLSPDHPDGRSKADFFVRFGFRREAWEILAAALKAYGAAYLVAGAVPSRWGTRYSVEGELHCPDGRRPRLRTVWIVETLDLEEEQAMPRLKMIVEHERIVLTDNVPEAGLKAGDVGTVVFVHNQGEAYEVEVLTLGGATAAVATVRAEQVRRINHADLAHVRSLAAFA